MIGFWIVAGLLVLAVLAVLLRPLLREPRGFEDSDDAVGMFRRQLADLDSESEQGRLAPETAVAARTEISRRMLAAADRESTAPSLAEGGRREFSWRIGTAVGLAGLLPIAAIATYFAVGTPAAIDPTQLAATGDPHTEAEFGAAMQRLTVRLQRDPKNVEDWVMLARTSAFLGRFGEAREAYDRAIALAPARTGLHAELGEVLVLEAQGVVTPAAQAEFAKTPDDPRARYYEAQAALQHGDRTGALRILQKLVAEAPADAPWRKFVARRLADLAPGAAPAAGASAPTATAGPSAQDVAAARAMSPQQRETMIRGMVARLAQRLEQHPDDKAGWARLARAYDVLGEPDKAKAARARAAAAGGSPPAPAAPR